MMDNNTNTNSMKVAQIPYEKKIKARHRKYDCIALGIIFVLSLVALIYYASAFNPVTEDAYELQQTYKTIFAIVAVVSGLWLLATAYRISSLMNEYRYYASVGKYTKVGGGMKKGSSVRRNRRIANTVIYIILVVMSVIWLIPFVLIVLQSFRCEEYKGVSGYILPQVWGIDNYIYLFTNKTSSSQSLPDFVQWYLNTFAIAFANCILSTLMVMLMSYGLSRLRFKGRKLMMNVMLILGMFPGFLTMIILYWLLKEFGMTQTGAVPGLILVGFASSGMGYYVAKGFLDTIPKSLDEAARIDGATRFQVFYKIILPLAKPIIIYTLLTSFMSPWADYIFASYIAFGTSSSYNVAVGLYGWLNKDQIGTHFTYFCAGGVVVAIPVVIIFMCLQKYYVEGVTGGAVKG